MHIAEKLASFSWLSIQEEHLLPSPFSSLGRAVSEEQGGRDRYTHLGYYVMMTRVKYMFIAKRMFCNGT
jgi:hypothetical protein